MAQKKPWYQSTKRNPVSGHDVYQDDKGRNILYVKSTGCGYVIAKKDESNFTLYHNRYLLVLIGILLAVNFMADLKTCLIIGAIAAVWLEYRYRKNWLPSLTCITNFKPEKKQTFLQAVVEEGNKWKCGLLAILYLLFGILMVVNGYQLNSAWYILAGDYVLLAITVYISFNYVQAFFAIHS
jgi:uncharacterized membrane protein